MQNTTRITHRLISKLRRSTMRSKPTPVFVATRSKLEGLSSHCRCPFNFSFMFSYSCPPYPISHLMRFCRKPSMTRVRPYSAARRPRGHASPPPNTRTDSIDLRDLLSKNHHREAPSVRGHPQHLPSPTETGAHSIDDQEHSHPRERTHEHPHRRGSPLRRSTHDRTLHRRPRHDLDGEHARRRQHTPTRYVRESERRPMIQRSLPRTGWNCVLHLKANHSLSQCRVFKSLSYYKRVQRLRIINACLRCGGLHDSHECKRHVLCKSCRKRHLSILHPPSRNDEKEELRTLAITDSIEISEITDSHVEKRIVLWKGPSTQSHDQDNEQVDALLEKMHESIHEVTLLSHTIITRHKRCTTSQADHLKATFYAAFVYAAECITRYQTYLQAVGLEAIAQWYQQFLRELRSDCNQKQNLLRASPTHDKSREARRG